MTVPSTLLDLAVMLDARHDRERQDHVAVLAGRLGYAEVWLPVGEGAPWPDAERIASLAATGPARVGLVARGSDADIVAGLRRVGDSSVLVDLPRRSPSLVDAVGGAASWRRQVRLPAFDAASAGTTVEARTRGELVRRVEGTVAARASAGLSSNEHAVAVAVPVAVGRTMNEAQARALREPRFAGEGHPRERGIFGTYEHAQEQVLELAAAGADVLSVTLADELDLADLLAQVRSFVVGATPVLHARRS